MRVLTIICTGFFAFPLVGNAAAAETAYVSDQLVITVRDAPRRDAEILASLRTGDAVTVLQRSSTGDFVQVRTAQGIEGWSLGQYLMDTPAASKVLAEFRSARDTQAEQIKSLNGRLTQLQTELAQRTKGLQQLTAQHETQAIELADIRAASAGALTLREQASGMRAQLETAEVQIAQLAQENEILTERARRDWFVAGAGVLGGGMLFGWVLSRLIRRRRWEW